MDSNDIILEEQEPQKSRTELLVEHRDTALAQIATKHFHIQLEDWNGGYPEDDEFYFENAPITLGMLKAALLDAHAAGITLARNARAIGRGK